MCLLDSSGLRDYEIKNSRRVGWIGFRVISVDIGIQDLQRESELPDPASHIGIAQGLVPGDPAEIQSSEEFGCLVEIPTPNQVFNYF